MKTCVILQSSYLPWRGYFDLIRQADVFVFYDHVQFTRRDWRTRNVIKAANGNLRLSVPVHARNHRSTLISDIRIDYGHAWVKKHLRSIEQAYAHAPFIEPTLELVRPILELKPVYLYELNRLLTMACWTLVSGKKLKTFAGDEIFDVTQCRTATDRLVRICKELGADRYLSGPSAGSYIDPVAFAKAGITLDYITYDYAPYPQQHGPFVAPVSIVDVLANLGPGSLDLALTPHFPVVGLRPSA